MLEIAIALTTEMWEEPLCHFSLEVLRAHVQIPSTTSSFCSITVNSISNSMGSANLGSKVEWCAGELSAHLRRICS